jgi:hypothetical protein
MRYFLVFLALPMYGQISCFPACGGGGGGGSVTAVTATAPLTSSGGATPNISASYQGGGSLIQKSTGSTTTGDAVEYDLNGNAIDAGFLASNVILATGSYSNPSWITGLAFSKITGTVNATQVNGASPAASASLAATNSSGQIVAAALTSGNIYTGNSSNLPVGATALPNGITATTQTAPSDASTKVATNAFVQNAVDLSMATMPLSGITGGTYSFASLGSGAVFSYTATAGTISSIGTIFNGASGYAVGDLLTIPSGNNDAVLRVTSVSGTAVTGLSILYGGTGYTSAVNAPTNLAYTIPFTFVLTGTLASDATFIMPSGSYLLNSNQWLVANNTTGAFSVKFCLTNGSDACTGTGVTIPQGTNSSAALLIWTDATNNIWAAASPPLPASAALLASNSSSQPTSVSVGTGLSLSGGTLSATASGGTVPYAFASLPGCSSTAAFYQLNDSLYTSAYCDGSSVMHYYSGGLEMFPSSGLSWQNQGSCSDTTTQGGDIISCPGNGTSNPNLGIRYMAYPTPPFTIDLAVRPNMSTNYQGAALMLTDGTKVEFVGFQYNSSYNQPVVTGVGCSTVSSCTTTIFSSVVANLQNGVNLWWVRLNDNGSGTRTWSYSLDGGLTFVAYGTESTTAYLTPTRIGYAPVNQSSLTSELQVLSWHPH